MTLKLAKKPRRRSAPSVLATDKQLRAGLPFRSLQRLQMALDVSVDEVAKLVRISPRTIARRKREGRFNLDESEHIHRFNDVLTRAVGLFEGDLAGAQRWL